jgi:hypothetical protein
LRGGIETKESKEREQKDGGRKIRLALKEGRRKYDVKGSWIRVKVKEGRVGGKEKSRRGRR